MYHQAASMLRSTPKYSKLHIHQYMECMWTWECNSASIQQVKKHLLLDDENR